MFEEIKRKEKSGSIEPIGLILSYFLSDRKVGKKIVFKTQPVT